MSSRLRPGKIDRLIGSFGPGDAGAAGAPVHAVDIGDRLFENDQVFETVAFDGLQEQPQRGELGVFPPQPAPDVERDHAAKIAQHLHAEDGAVKSSADQDGGGLVDWLRQRLAFPGGIGLGVDQRHRVASARELAVDPFECLSLAVDATPSS